MEWGRTVGYVFAVLVMLAAIWTEDLYWQILGTVVSVTLVASGWAFEWLMDQALALLNEINEERKV